MLFVSPQGAAYMLVTGPVHCVTCQMHSQLSQDIYLVFGHYRLLALSVFELQRWNHTVGTPLCLAFI